MAGPIAGLNGGGGNGQQNGPASTSSGQYINGTLFPNFSTTSGDQLYGEQGYFSPDPTIAASAWQLPQNAEVLHLPTGMNQTPASAKDRQSISQMVQMVDLLSKWQSGAKLSTTEVEAASQLGGEIARAAQLQGSKGHPQAIGKAVTEIATRLKNLGITPDDLENVKGSKVPQGLSTMLQNAGYGVTKNMTLEQMLSETTGPKAQNPLPVVAGSGTTVGQYVQNLGQLSKDQIYQLQQSMFNAGLYDPSYYDPSAKKSYTQGVLDTGTIMAFRNAMEHSFKTGQPIEQVIGGNLPMPGQNGTGATPAPTGDLPGTASTSIVPQTTATQLQSPLISAFQAALGRNPTQQELQAFTSTYNTEQQNASKFAVDTGLNSAQQAMDYQSGVPYINTTPTATASAASYAENANPIEYQSHSISNAFGMLMNLVDRQGTSAFTTPGHSPNTTS